jgi:hypothetical protein
MKREEHAYFQDKIEGELRFYAERAQMIDGQYVAEVEKLEANSRSRPCRFLQGHC